jgi:hypothetical protein
VSRYHPQVYAISLVANAHVLSVDVRWVLERLWQTVYLWLSPDQERLVPLALGYEITGRIVCSLPYPEDDPVPKDDGTLANALYECLTDWEPVLRRLWSASKRKTTTTVTPPPLPPPLVTPCNPHPCQTRALA